MRKRKLLASNVKLLDPKDCDSIVTYILCRGRRGNLTGTVDLSDCSRKIQWFFDKDDFSKVCCLVEFFEEFKTQFCKFTRRKKNANHHAVNTNKRPSNSST